MLHGTWSSVRVKGPCVLVNSGSHGSYPYLVLIGYWMQEGGIYLLRNRTFYLIYFLQTTLENLPSSLFPFFCFRTWLNFTEGPMQFSCLLFCKRELVFTNSMFEYYNGLLWKRSEFPMQMIRIACVISCCIPPYIISAFLLPNTRIHYAFIMPRVLFVYKSRTSFLPAYSIFVF